MNFWIKGNQGNCTHDNLDDLDNDNDETNQLNESLFVVDPLGTGTIEIAQSPAESNTEIKVIIILQNQRSSVKTLTPPTFTLAKIFITWKCEIFSYNSLML